MKPSKIDPKKKLHVQQLENCMHSAEYLWEEKLDGINIMSIGGRLYSNVVSKKTGWPAEKTLHFPQVAVPLAKISPYLILDGESYLPGWKSNNITSISNSDVPTALVKQQERGLIDYWVYDILRDLDGTWLTNQPFEIRRKRLEELFSHELYGQAHIHLNGIHSVKEENPKQALDDILSRGLEGIVLKRKDGIYEPGKRPMWNQVKLKASMEDDVVITGFEAPIKKYTGKNIETWQYWEGNEAVTENYAKGLIGSITIGKYDENGTLVDVGKVTGITDALRQSMTEQQDAYKGRVIIIKAMEKTEDGKYRHANFQGFHPDKRAEECKLCEND
jgi:ATP-dependent DNA ligase